MNRYEFVLSAIAEAQFEKLLAQPAPPPVRAHRSRGARPIRSLIVDAARPLHDAWDKLTRQPVPERIKA